MGREDRIYEEAAALWRALYGEPPPITADGGTMLDIIMRTLPEAGYERLRTPHLRPTDVVMPRPSA
ncbi:hypothetical protein [Phenylobacterium zucineum]|uniref:hypothetical protein n=1 Tax=Phenylobacterium zucineum TaxID=284016 RepID=UPI0002DF12B2|nr:hypothetical protein [Phenylobacterium zucineum]